MSLQVVANSCRTECISKRLACAVQKAGKLRDDISFGDSKSQSDAVCVNILVDAVGDSATANNTP